MSFNAHGLTSCIEGLYEYMLLEGLDWTHSRTGSPNQSEPLLKGSFPYARCEHQIRGTGVNQVDISAISMVCTRDLPHGQLLPSL